MVSVLTLVANSQNPLFCVGKYYIKARGLMDSRQFATSVSVGFGPRGVSLLPSIAPWGAIGEGKVQRPIEHVAEAMGG